MRLPALLFILLLLSCFVASDNDIYRKDWLQIRLDVTGAFELVPEGQGSAVKHVTSQLLLYPPEDRRQKIIEIDRRGGEVRDETLVYQWDNPTLGRKQFGYQAIVRTTNERQKVKTKIPYPLKDIRGYDHYTLPTAKIDSDNPRIIAQAQELAEGEDDLFVVVFKLAHWVSDTVDYSLNELTTDVAQPASWVMEHKEGACDEMTSLFVAMARSLGIPARFVSGISYTEAPEVLNVLGKNWASHGWAEVYFPDVGWVSFDITFDEYGYIDVTHIKLREGLDPDDPATTYQWVAERVQLTAESLNLEGKIQGEGNLVPEEILLEEELLAKETGIGSHNLVKGILKNTAEYYVATTLRLAAPPEVDIIGNNKRTILLAPKEVRETFWHVKTDGQLDEKYRYSFPLLIYSEKNSSVQDNFIAQAGKVLYSQKEIEELLVENEEKSYSRKISFSCIYPRELAAGEQGEARCGVRNNGDSVLDGLTFCVNELCQSVLLKPNEQQEQVIPLDGGHVGWNNIFVRAESEDVEKKSSFSYLVFDRAGIRTTINAPERLFFGDSFLLSIHLEKDSFAVPRDVKVALEGVFFQNTWEIAALNTDETVSLDIDGSRLSWRNTFIITTSWKDQEGRVQEKKEEIHIRAQGQGMKENFQMMMNSIAKLFYV